MKTPHVHAEYICAWAAGNKIQRRRQVSNGNAMQPDIYWYDDDNPEWDPDEVYRVKPAPAYPRSTLEYQALCDIVNVARKIGGSEGHETKLALYAADCAIVHFIESGGIEKWQAECEARGGRD